VAEPMRGVRYVTFDCYGTLVDWLGGVARFARGLLARKGRADVDATEFVREWERVQRRLIEPPYRPYGEILEESLAKTLAARGIAASADEARAFSASMGTWTPFPEVPAALRRAAGILPCVLVSNTDRAILEKTLPLLDAPIHRAISAEESRHYKPARGAFEHALRALGARPGECLHVSAYEEYDLEPARDLGMRTAYVRRPGLPPEPGGPVDRVLDDLAALPRVLMEITR